MSVVCGGLPTPKEITDWVDELKELIKAWASTGWEGGENGTPAVSPAIHPLRARASRRVRARRERDAKVNQPIAARWGRDHGATLRPVTPSIEKTPHFGKMLRPYSADCWAAAEDVLERCAWGGLGGERRWAHIQYVNGKKKIKKNPPKHTQKQILKKRIAKAACLMQAGLPWVYHPEVFLWVEIR